MSSRKTVIVMLIAAAALLASFETAFAAKTFLSIATGSTSGTYYPIGTAIAEAVSAATDIVVTPETGNAAVANVNLVTRGDIEIAFAQNDTAFWAYNGRMMFKSPMRNLRAIAALYPEHVQLITTVDSGIKKLADLKGKTVGVGAPGSGVEADVRAIFQASELKYGDMRVEFLDFEATTSRFRDNQIDAGFVVAGYPTASIVDLASTKEINLLSFDEIFLNQLRREHPYFVRGVIPAGTYRGVDTEIVTPSVVALLLTHEYVSSEVIYQFTKAMFENIEQIHTAHSMAGNIGIDSALDGITVPLHPGAERYYKELGKIK